MLNWATSGSAEELLGRGTQVRDAEVFAAFSRLVTLESTLPGSKALVETWIMSHMFAIYSLPIVWTVLFLKYTVHQLKKRCEEFSL